MLPFILGRTSRFRTSFTQREGITPAAVIQGRVVDVNVARWTVDVVSQFDRRVYTDIQVGSPYLHYNSGEGIYVVPEVGASCMVCHPSDSSPPFVLSFLMPHAIVGGGEEPVPNNKEDKPSRRAVDSTFSGNRAAAKPGDIVLKTRDGSFVVLHRGGVLQIGATELSQRVFIPLNNLMMDISGNYAHHNTAGSVMWGLQEGPTVDNLPCEFLQTFRVRANDAEADIRVRIGEVKKLLAEPSSTDGGEQELLDQLRIASDRKNNPVLCEVAVVRKGFVAGTGDTASLDAPKNTLFRFLFDRGGGTYMKCKGSLLISTKDKLHIKAKDTVTIEGKTVTLLGTDGMDVSGGVYTHVKGEIVRMGQGAAPVARQGDIVTVVVPPLSIDIDILGTTAAQGAPIVAKGVVKGGMMQGVISSGNSRVLA